MSIQPRPRTVVSEYRRPETDHVDPGFLMRWSPRSLRDDGMTRDHLMAILEAARWAPSSYNEQPWRFVYAIERPDRERLLEGLLEGNRVWAKNAGAIVLVLASPILSSTGKPNQHAWFDTGAAWMSIALQAGKLGLHTHAMGGIDRDKLREIAEVPDGVDIICAIAIGHQDAPELLPGPMAEIEAPSDRRPLGEIAHEGRYRRAPQ